MIDIGAVHLALRNRAMGVTIATTSSSVLAATSVGYTRQTGSFIDDQFRRGMDVVASGFSVPNNNVRSVITSVSPTEMRVTPFNISALKGVPIVSRPSLTLEAANSGRTIFAGLPYLREWPNETTVGLASFVPAAGIPYIEEQFSPSTSRTYTIPVSTAHIQMDGDYFLRMYGVAGNGSEAMYKFANALSQVFSAGTLLHLHGTTVRIPSDPAPVASGIIQTLIGPVITVTIPWITRALNSVLA